MKVKNIYRNRILYNKINYL